MGKGKPRHKQFDPWELFNQQIDQDIPDTISIGDDDPEIRRKKKDMAFLFWDQFYALRRTNEGFTLYVEDDGCWHVKAHFHPRCLRAVSKLLQKAFDYTYKR